MTNVLLVAVVLLAVAVAFNWLLLFAVIRRLRRVDVGGRIDDSLPRVGQVVSEFEVTLIDGGQLSSQSALRAGGEAVIAFITVGCSACEQLVSRLKGKRVPGSIALLCVVQDDEPPSAEALALATSLETVAQVAVISPTSAAARAVGGLSAFPTILRIKDGVVVGAGHRLEDMGRRHSPAAAM